MIIMFRISDSSKENALTLSEKSQDLVLGEKEEYYVGRRPDSEIHLESMAISGSHAKVIHLLSDTFVEDLGSSNGTFINGKKAEKCVPLRHGDVVTIGTHQLEYVNNTETEENEFFKKEMLAYPRSPLAAAAIIRLVEQHTRNVKHVLQSFVNDKEAQLPSGKITMQSGTGKGNVLNLRKVLTVLHRRDKPTAAFSRREEGVFLTYVSSGSDDKDYPLVNGESTGQLSCLLKDGDKISIRGTDLLFNQDQDNPE